MAVLALNSRFDSARRYFAVMRLTQGVVADSHPINGVLAHTALGHALINR